MKTADIRRLVNAYSRKTTSHPFEDYGNDIKITVNDDCDIYECLIQTQYEDRNVEEKKRPYRGWNVAPRKYFSIHDVAAWSYNLKTPEDFTNKDTYLEVEGSASVCECGPCRGKGNHTCYTCNGIGKKTCQRCKGDYQHLTCYECGGYGHRSCTSCGGTGKTTCTKCQGKGKYYESVSKWVTEYNYNLQRNEGGYKYVQELVTCKECNGTGKKNCSSCRGAGKYTCTRCDGRGTITCPDCTRGQLICKTCGGDGLLICQTCQGAGSNETRYIVNRSLTENTKRNFVCDNRVREFVENHDISYPDVEFNIREKALKGELYPEDVKCSSKLMKLLAKTEPESGKILFQEATVLHVVATVVEYDYDGSQYSGIICNDEFFPDNSPIDEWSAELVDNAERKMKAGSSAKTLKMLQQAEEAGADKDTIRTLRGKARKKLGNLQEAGASLAFWLVLLFLSPFVFNFYYKLNPVAPWAIVANNPHWNFYNMLPFCQTLIFLGAALILRLLVSRDSKKDYSSIWTYFAKGFFSYLLAALACLAVLLLVNYLGVSVITTFILGLIIMIVVIAIVLAYQLAKWLVKLIIKIF